MNYDCGKEFSFLHSMRSLKNRGASLYLQVIPGVQAKKASKMCFLTLTLEVWTSGCGNHAF